MKKSLLSVATLSLMLCSCSEMEILTSADHPNISNDGINFSPYAHLTTKAPVNNVTDLQGKPFGVAALLKGGSYDYPYLGEGSTTGAVTNVTTPVEVKYTAGAGWEYAEPKMWPKNEVGQELTFMAYYPKDEAGTVTITKDRTAGSEAMKMTFSEKEIVSPAAGAYANQTDLMYAVEVNQTRPAAIPAKQKLSFKHALTQIVFQAKVTPKFMRVKIKDSSVKIGHVNSKGSFLASTDYAAAAPAVQAAWNTLSVPAQYTAEQNSPNTNADAGGAKELVLTGPEAANFTSITAQDLDGNDKGLMLIPQNFQAWTSAQGVPGAGTGAYIEMEAVIYDYSQTAGQTDSGDNVDKTKRIYYLGSFTTDTEAYGKLYIPVSSLPGEKGEWLSNRKIVYRMDFGKVSGGGGSGGGGFDADGNPILVPIIFDAVPMDWDEVIVNTQPVTFVDYSDAIDKTFIDKNLKSLLDNIVLKQAAVAAIIDGQISIQGVMKEGTYTIDLTQFNSAAVQDITLKGSKMVIDMTKTGSDNAIPQAAWTASTSVALTVPTGWKAYVNGGSAIAAGAEAKLTAKGIITLIKD